MEPTLQQGDIVIVRKADGGLFPRLLSSWILGSGHKEDEAEVVLPLPPHQPTINFARLYHRPPQVHRGQVIVLKSIDTAFPDEWHIKRVWGTPGTWVQVDSNGRLAIPTAPTTTATRPRRHPNEVYTPRRKLKAIPSYSVYVGGDNAQLSRDSRQYGPVSQNLIVGIAEYIVWPPHRIRKLSSELK
jgi:signal peptidase I